MLHVADLHKSFHTRRRDGRGTVALDGVDLDVDGGSFTAILGPSGSGKTTLLRCIAGFERADAGAIALSDELLDSPDGTHVAPHSRRIGIVPQEAALFPHLSVAQNIAFGLTGMGRRARRDRVCELLTLIDLPDMAERRPHQLSGGQQQRVALARALAPTPRLILLDEPFSALDAKLRSELREQIRSLLCDLGTTTILVTHDQDEALTLCDHLVVLRTGRVVADGAPHDLYENPPDLETAEFLGRASVLEAMFVENDARSGSEPMVLCALGEVPVTMSGGYLPTGSDRCHLMMRPEQLSISPVEAHSGDRLPGVGTVTRVSYHGPNALVDIRIEAGLEITASVAGHNCPKTGDRVKVEATRPGLAYPTGNATA